MLHLDLFQVYLFYYFWDCLNFQITKEIFEYTNNVEKLTASAPFFGICNISNSYIFCIIIFFCYFKVFLTNIPLPSTLVNMLWGDWQIVVYLLISSLNFRFFMVRSLLVSCLKSLNVEKLTVSAIFSGFVTFSILIFSAFVSYFVISKFFVNE